MPVPVKSDAFVRSLAGPREREIALISFPRRLFAYRSKRGFDRNENGEANPTRRSKPSGYRFSVDRPFQKFQMRCFAGRHASAEPLERWPYKENSVDLSNAWINGRTLAQAVRRTGTRHAFGPFSPTARVRLQFPRDFNVLGMALENPFPFVVEDNLFVTVRDIQETATVIDFKNVRFTESALKSAASIVADDERTRDLEKYGENVDDDKPERLERSLGFSKLVCEWGDGQRVWGNLNRHYPREPLGLALSDWFASSKNETDPQKAVSLGIKIKGLGVSFASKHLRFLSPTRFPVLDDVISQGLGYALNPAGYRLFISDLREIQRESLPKLRVADIEAGVFVLVRQIVRGTRGMA